MSTERNMIGLSAQAHFVPQVPIDYGIRGTPSLVVKTSKGTNRKEYEVKSKRTRYKESNIVQKVDCINRMRIPGFNPNLTHEVESGLNSKIPDSQAKIPRQRCFHSLAPCFPSLSRQSRDEKYFKQHSKKISSFKINTSNRRWRRPLTSPPKLNGACLLNRSPISNSKINIIQQVESHPTGFSVCKLRIKLSASYQTKSRAHLLHRTIERYHE